MPAIALRLLPALVPIITMILTPLVDGIREWVAAHPTETILASAANAIWALFAKQPHKD